MNFVLRPENKNFTASINSPLLYYPKKIIPSLRADKQPLAIIGEQLSLRWTSQLIGNTKSMLGFTQKKLPAKNSRLFFDKMLKKEIENYSELPDTTLVTKSFDELKNYIKILEQKGVKIIFFEMPVNSHLTDLSKARLIRTTFFDYFPETKYTYILTPDFIKCKTTDGIHLTKDEALKYTLYLKNKGNDYFRK